MVMRSHKKYSYSLSYLSGTGVQLIRGNQWLSAREKVNTVA